ncbi:P-loop containing nucleoside triphosphate hydrolase protein [Zopfochytrium polystomum]|nr:P-loop containing nucleoside triphosphate hydrolase protein [Zopfochytrium polystomum]
MKAITKSAPKKLITVPKSSAAKVAIRKAVAGLKLRKLKATRKHAASSAVGDGDDDDGQYDPPHPTPAKKRKLVSRKVEKVPVEDFEEAKPEDHAESDSDQSLAEDVEFGKLPWREVETPSGIFMDGTTRRRGDEFGGYLCLEEIEGVDVDVVDGRDGSKTIKLKPVNGVKRKPAKPATPYATLPADESSQFIHIDEFSESDHAKKSSLAETKGRTTKKRKQSETAEVATNNLNESDYEMKDVNSGDADVDAEINDDEEELDKEDEEEEHDDGSDEREQIDSGDDDQEDEAMTLPEWSHLSVHPRIHRALSELSFTAPTPIQSLALAAALEPVTGHPKRKHVVGAAATGSGKTLAFGIPLVQAVAIRDAKEGRKRCVKNRPERPVVGIVLAPTRELAIQVTDHLKAIAKYTSALVVPVVGGMALDKQRRLLSYHPDIIVATPGRLWELASENDGLLSSLRCCQFLAIDEADRMLEAGHFKDLDKLLVAISLDRTDDILHQPTKAFKLPKFRQTFVFSATLSDTSDMFRNLSNHKKAKAARARGGESSTSIAALVERLNLEASSLAVVDTSTSTLLPAELSEVRVECMDEDKDAVLWYLLMRYSSQSRTLVFVNSIDSARRLVSVLNCVGVAAVTIHAEMQQRQRLKNLDRFRSSNKTVLVASDVAARGLDIPAVDHVIHYHLPRTAELYVHRSGRTARMTTTSSTRDGVSILLCGPKEVAQMKRLCRSLGRLDEATGNVIIPLLPMDLSILAEARKRVVLARKVEAEEHKQKKKKAESDWLKKAAEAADLILSDEEKDSDEPSAGTTSRKRRKVRKGAKGAKGGKPVVDPSRLPAMKAELAALLNTPVFPRGLTLKYPTSGMANDLSLTAKMDKAAKGESGQIFDAGQNAVKDASVAKKEGANRRKAKRVILGRDTVRDQ